MHFMCAHLYWSVWKKIRKCWTVLFKTLLIRRNIDLLRPRTQGHQSREDKKSPFILSCTNTFIYIVFATHSVLQTSKVMQGIKKSPFSITSKVVLTMLKLIKIRINQDMYNAKIISIQKSMSYKKILQFCLVSRSIDSSTNLIKSNQI